MPQLHSGRLFVLCLLTITVYFTHLGSSRLWDRDEPRNSRASHEMLARGDWIVPTFNGELRTHKPILLYWGQMLSYLSLGESEFAARLPSALAALLAVATVAILASRLSGMRSGVNRDGFWAGGALATSLLFVMAGRAATPDACLIAFSTLGIAALVIASLRASPPYSTGAIGKARWLMAMFGYAMLGLAVLAKGPVGILLPLSVVHGWWMICRRFQTMDNATPRVPKSFLSTCALPMLEIWRTFNPLQCLRAVWSLRAIPGVILALVVAAPWYVLVGDATDGEFLRGFFFEHNLGRAVSAMEGHGGSIFYYPVALLVGVFPWSLWLIPMLMWARTASHESVVYRQMVALAVVWIGVYVTAFSMASTKLPSYITPCYPGAALVIGSFLRQFETAWARPSRAWRNAAYTLTIIVGISIAGGILWLGNSEAMPLISVAALSGVIIAFVGALGFAWEYRKSVAWYPTTMLVGAAAFQVLLFGFGARSVDKYRDDLRVLAEVNEASPAEHWLSLGGMEPSWVHYLGQEITEVADGRTVEGWQKVREFLSRYPDGNVILVGNSAEEAVANQVGDWQVHELGRSERFLRPGEMRIVKLSNVTQASDGVATTRLSDSELDPMIPAQMVSAVTSIEEGTSDPATESSMPMLKINAPSEQHDTSNVKIKVLPPQDLRSVRESPSARYPNPLRPESASENPSN